MEGPKAGGWGWGAGLSQRYLSPCPAPPNRLVTFRSPGPGARPILHPGFHVRAEDVHVQPEMRSGGKLLGQVPTRISSAWLHAPVLVQALFECLVPTALVPCRQELGNGASGMWNVVCWAC